MNATEIKEKLIELKACEEAMLWADGKTLQEIWDTCPRGDWMLWLYRRANNYDLRTITLAKGHCANTVRHLIKDERSIKAVDAAISFGNGAITQDELNAAADAAAYAYAAAAAAADAADAYAADAAYAYAADAAYAAAAYATAAYAAAAADAAADAAYAYAADAAYAAAKISNQQLTANICRTYLPLPIL